MELWISWIDLARATEAELEALTEACEPATFGLDKEDVLDESYRKAGKMDSDNFLTRFDVNSFRIVDYVHEQLMNAADEGSVIRAELYKLNVYGKGSFFKSHKDTPRGETMFGSLVVVFPTAHEGGALLLRHNSQEWTFDSAALTKAEDKPSIAYIAFYSDVDHEVALVTSGHRVTLTYNLFFEDEQAYAKLPQSIERVAPGDNDLENALSVALSNPNFLPQGGYLGFGLDFKYPISQSQRISGTAVLKGSDAAIERACRRLSLNPSLYVVYKQKDASFLVPASNTLRNRTFYVEDIAEILCHPSEYKGHIIHEFGQHAPKERYSRTYREDKIRLAWVTPLTQYSHFRSNYIAYGNEASAACIYGDLCLAVEVGPYGDRGAKYTYAKESELEISESTEEEDSDNTGENNSEDDDSEI
ncbi:hypothetical protein DXG03_007459 [Asterophora parasitica]|uniref:Prolyl 4-hydroxylase alpha subunit Fe(2+) 2OG dioxygenase domain-containing protein n=1 Tax=Asterophora parasitica TaxID=117018 RepID=A0A9P7GDB5_9AGAR|nr:hypothetical protein DXG03_007459 [Asterophora parasitica]